MPCPHCKITIIKRSNNESAVSAAAYQSGEKLFSEYDQEQKYYPYKNEVTHKEILLPPHAPPEFADRNTLWNSAEAQEKQWNSQLARRFVLAIPREIPSEQHADLIMYIGSMHYHRQQITHSIHYDVPFASFCFFPPSIPRSSAAEVVFTLCESMIA